MAKKNDKKFEPALKRLESIVEHLEQDDLSLDDSLKLFEEGIGLVRSCSQILKDAEQKVSQLVGDQEGRLMLEEFDLKDDERD